MRTRSAAARGGSAWTRTRRHVLGGTLAVAACLAAAGAAGAATGEFKQTNLVSDQPGVALNVDPNLVNPWGLSASPTSPIWVANNVTGTSTLYRGFRGD